MTKQYLKLLQLRGEGGGDW